MAQFLPRLMRPRDRDEPHRASTPLELLFDLVFVVAVSYASDGLFESEVAGNFGTGVVSYLMVFFAIWWAWMNFTWFASAYDTDDWVYRVTTMVQMAGALALASGVPAAMGADRDYATVVIAYVVMRVAMITQWSRAAHADPVHRAVALRYAIGIAAIQGCWIAWLWIPHSYQLISFLAFAAGELAVVWWAERGGPATTWHPGHIAERYGLFTLIVLGEAILASTHSVIDTIDEHGHLLPLLTIAASALVIVCSMWWVYFDRPQDERLANSDTPLLWGFGHYLVFSSAAAVAAGVEMALAHETGKSSVGAVAAAAALTVPVAVFLMTTWTLLLREQSGGRDRLVDWAIPALAALIALSALFPGALPIAAVLTALAAATVSVQGRLADRG